MLRWILTCTLILGLAAAGFYWLIAAPRPVPPATTPPPTNTSPAKGKPAPAKRAVHAAEDKTAPAATSADPAGRHEPPPPVAVGAQPLIVIPEGRVTAIDKQEVPAQHEGQILFIGTEITEEEAKKLPLDLVLRARVGSLWVQLAPGEKENYRIPDSELHRWRVSAAHRDRDSNSSAGASDEREYRRLRDDEEVAIGKYDTDPHHFQLWREPRLFRRLQEGDEVAEGQWLGLINPALAVDDLAIKMAKLRASYADLETSQKTRDEAEQRYKTSSKLYFQGRGVESEENMRGAELTWKRYIYEAISKTQAISVAASELKQAQTTLEMHVLRSKIPGRIKTIYKSRGEAVKNGDPLLQIFNPTKLRIEGLVEMQYAGLLQEGMEVVVEPTRFARHEQLLRGHLQEITGLAVSKKNEIVSASEDRTVRVWDRSGIQKVVLHHPTAVRAVACTPPGSQSNLCLTAGSDGVARLFDLDSGGGAPIIELQGGHRGSMNCVAFGPQGKWCATGGDDRAICLWDTATGAQLQRFAGGQKNPSAEAASAAGGHRGAVTSLAFLSANRLVSAGTDKTLLVWTLKDEGSKDGPPVVIDRRSGDVASLGVSPLEQTVLFDYGRELRVLTVPDQKTVGVLQTASSAMNFSTLAQFSPDGKLILTAGSSDNRLQLWRAPTDQRRAYEVCQLISPSAATCGAFAPDGSFLVTGTRDRQVLIWKAPTTEEMAELTATVKLIEKALDSNSRQVRIWADVKEPQGLVPGATATMVVYP
jgi:WD40 repeat protein